MVYRFGWGGCGAFSHNFVAFLHACIAHRKGLDFFKRAKFDHPIVKEKIQKIFGNDEYQKILVVYQTHPSLLPKDLEQFDIKVWFIADIIRELKKKGQMKGSRDDVLRVIELIRLVEEYEEKRKQKKVSKKGKMKQ